MNNYYYTIKIIKQLKCNEFDIKVMSVTCNGAHANYITFKILGCNFDQLYDLLSLSSTYLNLMLIYIYTFDTYHTVKLARNVLENFGVFKDVNKNLIQWKCTDRL